MARLFEDRIKDDSGNQLLLVREISAVQIVLRAGQDANDGLDFARTRNSVREFAAEAFGMRAFNSEHVLSDVLNSNFPCV